MYPELTAFEESNLTDPTNIVIRNWIKPPSVGMYTLPIQGPHHARTMNIQIMEMSDPKIEEYGVKLLTDSMVWCLIVSLSLSLSLFL